MKFYKILNKLTFMSKMKMRILNKNITKKNYFLKYKKSLIEFVPEQKMSIKNSCKID